MSKGKKVFIMAIDIITLIIIILHIQSYTLFIMKRFHILYNYPLKDIIYNRRFQLFEELFYSKHYFIS